MQMQTSIRATRTAVVTSAAAPDSARSAMRAATPRTRAAANHRRAGDMGSSKQVLGTPGTVRTCGLLRRRPMVATMSRRDTAKDGHHVLVVPVPRLEAFVLERTRHYDDSFVSTDAAFVHAHITLLAP